MYSQPEIISGQRDRGLSPLPHTSAPAPSKVGLGIALCIAGVACQGSPAGGPVPPPSTAPSTATAAPTPRAVPDRASQAAAPAPAASAATQPSSVASSETAPPEVPESIEYVVAAMGDSLTDPKSHGGKYLDYLRQHCPESTFISFGKGADMVNQMRRRFQSQVLAPVPVAGKSHYTDVIIFGGVNDLYSDLTAHRTVEKISADLSAMYQMSRDRGIRVVAITVSPWGGFKRYHNDRRQAATLRLSEFIFEQQRQQQVDFVVDTVPLLSCGDPEHLCPAMAKPFRDGLHFGPKGHEILGAALLKTAFQNCR